MELQRGVDILDSSAVESVVVDVGVDEAPFGPTMMKVCRFLIIATESVGAFLRDGFIPQNREEVGWVIWQWCQFITLYVVLKYESLNNF